MSIGHIGLQSRLLPGRMKNAGTASLQATSIIMPSCASHRTERDAGLPYDAAGPLRSPD